MQIDGDIGAVDQRCSTAGLLEGNEYGWVIVVTCARGIDVLQHVTRPPFTKCSSSVTPPAP